MDNIINDAENKFIVDFIKAKKHFAKTGLSAFNGHFKSKYAPLVDVYKAVEDALHEHNICITHQREWKDGKTYLVTKLRHISGHYIEDTCLVESEKPGNGAHGSALTFMRRYAVLNLCAIAAEADDDAQEEQKYIDKKQYTKPELLAPQYINGPQSVKLEEESEGLNDEIQEIILKSFGIDAWPQLTTDKFDIALNAIKKGKED